MGYLQSVRVAGMSSAITMSGKRCLGTRSFSRCARAGRAKAPQRRAGSFPRFGAGSASSADRLCPYIKLSGKPRIAVLGDRLILG